MLRALFSGLFVATVVASATARADDAGAPAPLPSCVKVTTESRYVPYGYNHIVHVQNGCAKTAACTVATDVNPQPQSVEVAPASTADVTTYMGSASSTFLAKVACVLR